jgi:hypothetical protein
MDSMPADSSIDWANWAFIQVEKVAITTNPAGSMRVSIAVGGIQGPDNLTLQ